MKAERYYIAKVHWQTILKDWLEHHLVIAPIQETSGVFLEPLTAGRFVDVVYDEIRPVDTLKKYLWPPLQTTGWVRSAKEPLLFLAIKCCDLESLPVLDRVFTRYPDPAYKSLRENSLFIGADCTRPSPACSCTWVHHQPYPVKHFDLNLTKLWDGFVVEVGSERGRSLIARYDQTLKETVREEIDIVKKTRRETEDRIRRETAEFKPFSSYHGLTQLTTGKVWAEPAMRCTACGACTNLCPTCLCTSAASHDEGTLRHWDSCQYSKTTTMMPTPARTDHLSRFSNRYLCKFKSYTDRFGLLGCTGCGRCMTACLGKIDQREVLEKI
jgi:sulfhydrogenase subunit beta (sulfur reductase)